MQLLFVTVVLHVSFTAVHAVYECISGMWGPQCTKTCGFCEGGNEFCHVYDGYCVNGCASGYTGVYCKEQCPLGRYGQYCRRKCGRCSYQQPVCDRESGKCLVGCEPGYQMPYCYIPCPYNTWGEGCINQCKCTNATRGNCTCNAVTGACPACDPRTDRHYYPVKEPKCLQEHKLFGKDFEYVPPNVLDFPYEPILTVGGTIIAFVFGNFLWWFFIVRSPKQKEKERLVRRARKPPKVKTAKFPASGGGGSRRRSGHGHLPDLFKELARYRKALADYEKLPKKAQRSKSMKSRSYSVDDGRAVIDDEDLN